MHISRPLSGTQNEVWRQGWDWWEWEWRLDEGEKQMKNNIKGGFEQNNDGSVISSLVFIWDKNK